MPGLFTIFVYYALLLAVLTGWLFKANRRPWKIAGVVLVAVIWCGQWLHEHSAARITVIPLNGGSSVYCDSAGRSNDMLIDCGSAGSVEFVVKPYLRAHGVNSLPRMALTVGEARQVGGFEKLTESVPIEKVGTSEVKFRSPVYRDVIQVLQKTPGRRQVIDCGDIFDNWTVLHPSGTNHFTEADDNALVLQRDFQGARVLVLSDLGREGQSAILEGKADLRADIVIAGLPEQGEPLCNALLEAIQPKLIVIADSDFPVTRRASRALQTRLSERKIPVIYTRLAGAARITIRKGGWEASSAEGARLAGGTDMADLSAKHSAPRAANSSTAPNSKDGY
jgi:beta-lactamase superfamily II metal-dependent hydrolase